MILFFLFIDITHLLFELLCMYVCYLLFPINNNNNLLYNKRRRERDTINNIADVMGVRRVLPTL